MNKILQYYPVITKEEKKKLINYLSQDYWLTENKFTKILEYKFSKILGVKHCIATNNGSVTLYLIGKSLGLGKGDEVIIPNITMIATAYAFYNLGCKIKFVDVEKSTLCIDINHLKQIISNKTKAVVFVNFSGRNPSYDIKNLLNLCKNNNTLLIEDSAHSLNSFYNKNMHHGSIGIASSFSFSPAKLITSGQGGMIATNSSKIAKFLRKYKDFGRKKPGADFHDQEGLNYKFTDLQACLLLGQLEQYKKKSMNKKRVYNLYVKYIKQDKNKKLYKFDIDLNTPWFIDIRVKKKKLLKSHLLKNGIGVRDVYPPIDSQKIFKNLKKKVLKNSYDCSFDSLWLPSAINLREKDIKNISNLINSFYE